jgi:hypothetical protein
MNTYYDAVIPSKDSKLIKSGNKIPPGGRVASNKDANRDNRERVHELLVVFKMPRSEVDGWRVVARALGS